MAAAGGTPAVVLDANNRLAGILTLADVDRTVRLGGIHVGRR
jgi:CBS domain-containing protein